MAVVINGTTGIDTVQPLNQTVTATGKLGIGVTSPTGKVHIKNDSAVATNAQTAHDNASLRLDNLNTGSSIGLSFGLLGANTNYIQGGYNEGTVAPIALNPYGGGVAIGGTAAANTMDEYEEGTWVAEFRGSGGSAGSASTTVSMAQYTRIGRLVTIQCDLRWAAIGSWSGNLELHGLPFTVGVKGQGTPGLLKRIEITQKMITSVAYPSGTVIKFFDISSDASVKAQTAVTRFNDVLNEFTMTMSYSV
jgi:hypothetical protein